MFCPSCGKSIPEESKYCLHCGKPISTTEASQAEQSSYSDNPPAYFKDVGYKLGNITDSQGRCGVTVWFILLDKSLKPTRARGKLKIRLHDPYYGFGKDLFRTTLELTPESFNRPGSQFLGYVYDHPEPVADIGKSSGFKTLYLEFAIGKGEKLNYKG